MYSIKLIKCKDGKERKAVINEFNRIVTFDPLLVYLVEKALEVAKDVH